ncbi:MAG: hypothetical protein EHM28_00850 [Spirochaetaceae bacterium]|nr:MAG: hypothetical protein EHM28_00850 [Spirochaetaceae bacterium]
MIFEEFEQSQKKRTLIISLAITLVLCIILGLMNLLLYEDSLGAAIILFLTSLIAGFSVFLSFRSQYFLASLITVTLVVAAVLFNIYDGQRLSDSAGCCWGKNRFPSSRPSCSHTWSSRHSFSSPG